MAVGLTGCNGKDAVGTSADAQDENKNTVAGLDEIGYILPYLRSDSLNPYEAEQLINQNLDLLLYDSLFTVDNSFKAIPQIAESYSTEEKTITVILKSGVTFTDGSALTASDVVYSFQKAKKSDRYSRMLSNITSVADRDSQTVVFNMKDKSPYEVNNLTFAVIKSGSDSKDGELPTGSGRYTLVDGDDKYLKFNENRLGGYSPRYNMIGLLGITEASSVSDLFSVSEIDFSQDNFDEGKYVRYSGETTPINLSNFVYLGIKSSNKTLNDSSVRRAIALALNRKDLASVSYAGFAKETSTPCCSDFYAIQGCTLPPIKQNKEAAKELLDEAGYSTVSELGIRYGSGGSLYYTMAVNKDNSFKRAMARSIQQSLEEVNIKVQISEYPYEQYLNAVKNGKCDLYLSETKLNCSFDLSEFFDKDGGLSYGIDEKCPSAEKYREFKNGEATMQNFLDAFADDLPFIPLAYRQGAAVKSEKIKTQISPSVGDCFADIDEWTV